MKDIGLPEFGSPEDFVDLHDIVKKHVEQDSTWIVLSLQETLLGCMSEMPGNLIFCNYFLNNKCGFGSR
jgi:hypothetical protein